MSAMAISKRAVLLALKAGKTGEVRVNKGLLPINSGIDSSRLDGGVTRRGIDISSILGRPPENVHLRHLIPEARRSKGADTQRRVEACYLSDGLSNIGTIRSKLTHARPI